MLAMFLADGFEEIEALAVVDILRRANIEIHTVSINEDNNVTGAHDIKILSDKCLKCANLDKYEGYILPGGMPGTTNLQNNETVTNTIITANKNGKIIAAICAAPSVFGTLGLLNNKKAISYPGFESKLIGATITNERVVVDGNIITSKGAGTAHDFAFEIVKILKGKEKSDEIRSAMQY